MLSYSLLITISPHILAETPDEIIDDLNKEKISLIKQESSLKNQILDLDKTFNNSINEIDNEIKRTKKGFRDEKIDSSIRDLKSSSQKFTILVNKKVTNIEVIRDKIKLLDIAISAKTRLKIYQYKSLLGGNMTGSEDVSDPMPDMSRFIEALPEPRKKNLYEWCKTTQHCYPGGWSQQLLGFGPECYLEDYYADGQYLRRKDSAPLPADPYQRCQLTSRNATWWQDDIKKLAPVIDQLKKEVASVDLEIKDINNSKRSLNEDIKKLNIEKNEKISKLISPLINRQDKLKQEHKQSMREIENGLPSLRSQISQINARILEQKNISARIETTKRKRAEYDAAFKKKIQNSLVFIILISFLLFVLHRLEMSRERNLSYVINRGSNSGISIMRIFRGKKERIREFEEFCEIQKPSIVELINKAFNVIIDKKNALVSESQNKLQEKLKIKNKEMENNEKENLEQDKKLDVFIQSKREEIDDLQKQIEREKDIYKKLQKKHKYLGEWVKNR